MRWCVQGKGRPGQAKPSQGNARPSNTTSMPSNTTSTPRTTTTTTTTHKPVYKPCAPLSRPKRPAPTALSSFAHAAARCLDVPDLQLATASCHRHPSRAGGGEASNGHVATADTGAAAEGLPRVLLTARWALLRFCCSGGVSKEKTVEIPNWR